MMTTISNDRVRRAVRAAAGMAGKSCPVVVLDEPSDLPPRVVGEEGHYVNKSGDRITHPNAYRRAWGKPIYVQSTIQVEVGRDFVVYIAGKLGLHVLEAIYG